MADITDKDIKVHRYGVHAGVDSFPVLGGALIRGGQHVVLDADGYAFGASITGSNAYAAAGVARRDVDNSSGASGDLRVEVERDYYLDNDSTNPITAAHLLRSYAYFVDNHTAGSSDVGGTLPVIGVPVALGTGALAGKVAVRVGAVTPYAPLPATLDAYGFRGVALNLPAGSFSAGVYTATANGAMATQDGLTIAVNDVVILPEGTLTTLSVSAANSGPYVVTSIGSSSSKIRLARPSWWAHGAGIPAGKILSGRGGGTLYGGVNYKAICAGGLVIGTGDPGLVPGRVSQAVTFSSGSSGAITTVPLRASGKSDIVISNTGTASHASTRVWRVAAYTAGALGTASFTVNAESAPGTTNTSDVGVYTISVISW